MSALLSFFNPQPHVDRVPTPFPSPFASVPHPLAVAAADIVRSELSNRSPEGHDFFQPTDGKMIGVLVVQTSDGQIGFLRAVSGMLSRQWNVPGYVPPLFDLEAREAFWPAGQVRLDELGADAKALVDGPIAKAKRDAAIQDRRHTSESTAIVNRLRLRKEQRAKQRLSAQEGLSAETQAILIQKLSLESQSDKKESKRAKKTRRREREVLRTTINELESQRLSLKRARTAVSNALLDQIQSGYQITNTLGETRSLQSFFFPAIPPGGSADCAAPKLLGYANQHKLRPIALAEFWWGASPIGSVRHHQYFYPPCRRRCHPILPFMLEGLDVEPAPFYGTLDLDNDEPKTIYEDKFLVVVNKPAGMLSVPGKSALLQDSVLTRLKQRYPEADGPLLVHRLDLDTSGLLIAAKNADMFRAMQRLFASRQVDKTYLAWLDGTDIADRGRIALALRVDIDDRPRQVVDHQHGKPCITDYEVIRRSDKTTLVAFYPRTGRTHQLRVHASHAQGLAAPVVGDRLYGQPGPQLYLHAHRLAFIHPDSGQNVTIECPPPSAFPG